MRLGILVAGLTGVTIGAPALAEAPIALHPTTQIAQALTPPFPPPVTVPVAPPQPTGGDPAALTVADLCVGAWTLVVERDAVFLAAG